MKYISIRKKVLIAIICVLILLVVFCKNSQAVGQAISSADEFLGKGNGSSVINEDALKSTSNFMYTILVGLGVLTMFIVGTIIGIKFMISGADEKAKVQESLIPFVIGCAVIFGAFAIWSAAVTIGGKIAPDTGQSSAGNSSEKHNYVDGTHSGVSGKYE